MDKFLIEGGKPLEGRIHVSGAKNAALPAMAAALLTDQRVVLRNVPRVRDIGTMRSLLDELGVDSAVEHEEHGNRVEIQARKLESSLAPYELVKQMRASVLVLGPLVARFGQARVSLPGGCAIGARPINLHLKGLEALGAKVDMDHGYVNARADRLAGAPFYFDTISVTGTENLMMAATLAEGETLLENCASEPEVEDLADLLIKMGASIEGAGTGRIRIRGVARLRGADHTIIPDRIEAGTFLTAAAITGGRLTLEDVHPGHLTAIVTKLSEVGVKVTKVDSDGGANRPWHRMEVQSSANLNAVDVVTQEYPGFATDMQAQYMALMTQAQGSSVITETIFENRFLHAQELLRLGADITVDGRRAVVKGKTPLSGAMVQASDLRASASLVLAGLAAEGETMIDRVYHIDRGYERIEEKLSKVGAKIRRVSEAS
ncbi:MAG TPA: UDP-N-acetylglucosamine 1-carboxyvinyltransferase [Terriglobia bacterium]|nr:UDP-N-acetylglucosamine 1-carboxyvinyltransferase [Terriglobia bacterium]